MPAVGPDAEHEATATFAALFVEQVIVTQALPDAAVCGEQEATGTLVVTIGAGQVVVTQLLPDDSPLGVQDATATLRALFELQVVAV